MSSPTELKFSIFPQLPTELRLAIWRLCLPHRVLELDYPIDNSVFSPGALPWWYRTNHKITKHNTRVPVIARVCRESRQVVFETWSMLARPEQGYPAYWSERWTVDPDPWFDRVRTEIVHLGWWEGRDPESPYDGDPVRYLLWAAAQTKHGRVSVPAGFLMENVGLPDGVPDSGDKIWKRDDLAELMRQRPEWNLTTDEYVVVNADRATAAALDLFGLLVDSRVQMVDIDDEALMDRFLALDEVPGVTLTLNADEFGLPLDPTEFKEGVRGYKTWVSAAVSAIFGSEENAPMFRVVVMFRLCSEMSGPDY